MRITTPPATGAYPAIVLGPGSGYALVSDEDAHDPAGSGNGVMWQAGTDGGSDQGLRVFTGDGSEHSLEFLGDGVLKVDGEPVGASAPSVPFEVGELGNVDDVTVTEVNAHVAVPMAGVGGLLDGWTLGNSDTELTLPSGRWHVARLECLVNGPTDAPWQFEVMVNGARVAILDIPVGPAYPTPCVLSKPFQGTGPVTVVPGYSDTAPTTGEVGFRLTIWPVAADA